MIITAANQKFSFFLDQFKAHCRSLSYEYLIYDLGGLGEGLSWSIVDLTFQMKGIYDSFHSNDPTRFSRALHKPSLIKHALETVGEFTYMDADAFPIQRFDEVFQEDFDIGVTIRNDHIEKINAGVMFFKKTAMPFLEEWIDRTNFHKNDQIALNEIVNDGKFHIKQFPCEIYNYYFFRTIPSKDVKILHFKNRTARPYFLNYAKIF